MNQASKGINFLLLKGSHIRNAVKILWQRINRLVSTQLSIHCYEMTPVKR